MMRFSAMAIQTEEFQELFPASCFVSVDSLTTMEGALSAFTLLISAALGLEISLCSTCGKNLRWKIKIETTPMKMDESAILNTGLKNKKYSPPTIGIQS